MNTKEQCGGSATAEGYRVHRAKARFPARCCYAYEGVLGQDGKHRTCRKAGGCNAAVVATHSDCRWDRCSEKPETEDRQPAYHRAKYYRSIPVKKKRPPPRRPLPLIRLT